ISRRAHDSWPLNFEISSRNSESAADFHNVERGVRHPRAGVARWKSESRIFQARPRYSEILIAGRITHVGGSVPVVRGDDQVQLPRLIFGRLHYFNFLDLVVARTFRKQ